MSSNDRRKAWNAISAAYQNRYKINIKKIHYGPLCPSEDRLKLIGDVKNRRILELGAGAGQNSIYLAKKGACVTAVDISDEQIKAGKIIAAKANIPVNYIRSSFRTFKPHFKDNYFDIVISVYALQYCKDVIELKRVLSDLYKVLKPSGFIVFSVGHPIRSKGYWAKGTDVFVFDNYFDNNIKTWDYSFPEANISVKMVGCHKTISQYLNAVIEAGFTLNAVIEPKPLSKDANSNFGVMSRYGKNSKLDPYSYDHLERVPGTLIIRAMKR